MKISLSVDSYKGVDGSSLSPIRCSQIVSIYEMLESMGDQVITYVGLQELAENKHLFGKANAKSAVRTFFPLLKKLGFVNYEGSFAANRCFTETGTKFVLASRALSFVDDNTPNKDEIISTLETIKSDSIKLGLINMNANPDYDEHNIWIVLRLFKEFGMIDWNEFLYALHCKENGRNIDDAINDIHENKALIDEYEYTNDKDEPLPNTCYSYIRSLLIEAGLITNTSPRNSKATKEAQLFFSQISL